MKKKIINAIGCAVARWVLHNCVDGLVVRRKGGAEQIIKVFSAQAYRNVIRPAIRRVKEGPFQAGDVVTDNGYYRDIVITYINDDGIFHGYALADGVAFRGLNIKNFSEVVGHVDVKVRK